MTILWRRLDEPGHEYARLRQRGEGWELAGSAVFSQAGMPCALSYRVGCDAGWRTRDATVRGWAGDHAVDLELGCEGGLWRVNGGEVPEVEGCMDLDLSFSPSTNLLPLRRLELGVGDEAAVRAAWLRLPSLALEPLEQRYRRLSQRQYHYQSAAGAFERELTVDEAGWVVTYPGLWVQEG